VIRRVPISRSLPIADVPHSEDNGSWVQTSPYPPLPITVSPGQTVSGKDFGNFRLMTLEASSSRTATATVSGSKTKRSRSQLAHPLLDGELKPWEPRPHRQHRQVRL